MTDDELRKLLAEATEGPWQASPADDEKTAKMFWYVYSPFGSIMAEVATSIGTGRSPELVEANARLIAAAPDLAAEVLRLREWQRKMAMEDAGYGVITKLEAEIKKLKQGMNATAIAGFSAGFSAASMPGLGYDEAMTAFREAIEKDK